MKARLQKLLAEYGGVALYTYLALSILAIAGFSIAIAIGLEPSSATGMFGVIGAGWLAAKATMPLRILATLALTPVIATLVRRITKRKTPDSEEPGDDEEAEAEASRNAADDQANVGK
jgi:membrane protein implicated in regulation of membrane protease activity